MSCRGQLNFQNTKILFSEGCLHTIYYSLTHLVISMLKNDNATFQSFDNKIVFQVTDWNILNEISADNFFICESVALFRFNSYSWSEDFNI